MDTTQAIYRPFDMAFPMKYAVDMAVCKGPQCAKCVDACKYEAIELGMESKTLKLNVGAIVWSTGWTPYAELSASDAQLTLRDLRDPEPILNLLDAL